MLVSVPLAAKATAPFAAALVRSKKFSALAVVLNTNISAPLASAIKPPFANLGSVKVLLLKVWVWASKTNVSLPPNKGRVIVLFAVSSLEANW